MFRPPSVPARGHGAVARQLGRLPSQTHVRLHHGAVYVKAERRWLVAGVIGEPVTSTTLAKLNGGVMPVPLVPAWEPVGAVAS